jgi:hypothetical protein
MQKLDMHLIEAGDIMYYDPKSQCLWFYDRQRGKHAEFLVCGGKDDKILTALVKDREDLHELARVIGKLFHLGYRTPAENERPSGQGYWSVIFI